MICPNSGCENKNEARFCLNCGYNLVNNEKTKYKTPVAKKGGHSIAILIVSLVVVAGLFFALKGIIFKDKGKKVDRDNYMSMETDNVSVEGSALIQDVNGDENSNNSFLEPHPVVEQIKNARTTVDYANDTLVNQMNTVLFGSYPQSDVSGSRKDPIEWIVLEKQNDKALLMSKLIIENDVFSNQIVSNYNNSSIREYLNNSLYYSIFGDEDKNIVLYTDIDGVSNNLFLISYSEFIKYFGTNVTDNKKGTSYVTDYLKYSRNDITVSNKAGTWYYGNSSYWLRDIVGGNALYVGLSGKLKNTGDSMTLNDGVRPAVWVSLN